MKALFADLPMALDATVEIAERCHTRPKTANHLPRFTKGADEDGESQELRRQAEEMGLWRALLRMALRPAFR